MIDLIACLENFWKKMEKKMNNFKRIKAGLEWEKWAFCIVCSE